MAQLTAFTGFTDETEAFYLGLEADNSRAYWQDHREIYERAVRDPMTALTAALEPRFGPAKLFRPHRDVRFSADKSPYKTHQGAVVPHPGGGGVRYLQVSADGLRVGGGIYRPARDQLDRFRAAVAADATGVPFAELVAERRAEGWELFGETLQRPPRGVDAAHPRVELLKHKSVGLGRDHGAPDWFTTPECLDRVADDWTRLESFLDWLARHVGESTLP